MEDVVVGEAGAISSGPLSSMRIQKCRESVFVTLNLSG
jgi:hypothetical protein